MDVWSSMRLRELEIYTLYGYACVSKVDGDCPCFKGRPGRPWLPGPVLCQSSPCSPPVVVLLVSLRLGDCAPGRVRCLRAQSRPWTESSPTPMAQVAMREMSDDIRFLRDVPICGMQSGDWSASAPGAFWAEGGS